MKYIIGVCLIAGNLLTLCAQDLTTHVPNTAAYTIAVDLQRIADENIVQDIKTIDEVRNANYTKKGIELIGQIVANPDDYGIDITEKAVVFLQVGDTVENLCILLGIKDKEVFKREALQVVNHNNPDKSFTSSSGMEYVVVANEGIGISNDVAIIVFGDKQHFYASMPSEYYAERRDLIAKIRKEESGDTQPEPEEAEVPDEEIEVEIDEETEVEIDEEYTEYDEAIAEVEDVEYDRGSEYYEDHPEMIALKAKYDSINDIKEREFYIRQEEITNGYLDYYFNLPNEQSAYFFTSFREGMAEKADITIWISGQGISPLMPFYNKRRYRRAIEEGIQEENSDLNRLLENNFSMIYLDMNDGRLDIRNIQFIDPELDKFIPVRTESLSKQMYDYLPENPLIFLSLNLDPEKFFDMQMHFWRSYLTAMSGNNFSGNQLGALELMDLFLDKDVLFHTLTGEGIFEVHGVNIIENERSTYEYDENYSRIEVTTIDTTYEPVFLWIMKLENEQNMRKLMEIYVHFKALYPAGEDYWVPVHSYSSYNRHFKIGIRNGFYFMTNDSLYTVSMMENGLPKNQRLNGDDLRKLKDIENGFYLNREGQPVPVRRYTSRQMEEVLDGMSDGYFKVQAVESGKIISGGSFEMEDFSSEDLTALLEALLSFAH